jgi:hypothetical protein
LNFRFASGGTIGSFLETNGTSARLILFHFVVKSRWTNFSLRTRCELFLRAREFLIFFALCPILFSFVGGDFSFGTRSNFLSRRSRVPNLSSSVRCIRARSVVVNAQIFLLVRASRSQGHYFSFIVSTASGKVITSCSLTKRA